MYPKYYWHLKEKWQVQKQIRSKTVEMHLGMLNNVTFIIS